MKADPTKLRIAAIFGFLAVALGAMGAHALNASWEAALPALEAAKRVDVWKTASLYHIVHSVVLLVLAHAFADAKKGRCICCVFAAGIIIFSGSLYAFCITGIHWLGRITPVGGVFLMIGWLLVGWNARRD